MEQSVVRVMGHHVKEGGRTVFDGRVKFDVTNPPDALNADGILYQSVGRIAAKVTPEDGMARVVR